jgi:hypothetical protein
VKNTFLTVYDSLALYVPGKPKTHSNPRTTLAYQMLFPEYVMDQKKKKKSGIVELYKSL